VVRLRALRNLVEGFALRYVGGQALARDLIRALDSTDETTRATAGMELVHAGATSLPSIRDAIDHGNTNEILIQILGSIGGEGDRGRLEALAESADPDVWQAARNALRELGERGFGRDKDLFIVDPKRQNGAATRARLETDPELRAGAQAMWEIFPSARGEGFDGKQYSIFVPRDGWSLEKAALALRTWADRGPKDVRLNVEIRGPAYAL
jgi:hypothetical protein